MSFPERNGIYRILSPPMFLVSISLRLLSSLSLHSPLPRLSSAPSLLVYLFSFFLCLFPSFPPPFFSSALLWPFSIRFSLPLFRSSPLSHSLASSSFWNPHIHVDIPGSVSVCLCLLLLLFPSDMNKLLPCAQLFNIALAMLSWDCLKCSHGCQFLPRHFVRLYWVLRVKIVIILLHLLGAPF